MSKFGSVLRGILVWSYERGTLQYDIICALILAFIFLTPRSCFEARKQVPPAQSAPKASETMAPEPAPANAGPR